MVAKRAIKDAKKMSKMLGKMNLDSSAIQNAKKKKIDLNSSSDSDSDSESDDNMEVDEENNLMQGTRLIQKSKPRSRSYYRALKKSLRRKIKDGQLPDVAKLDEEIERLKMEM